MERARPLLEQLMAEASDDWHRVVLFPNRRSAGQVRARLAKAYGREWEWEAVSLPEADQSAVYVRWLGSSPTVPL